MIIQRFIHTLSERHLIITLLVCVIIVGGFIRFHNLGEHSLWIDEGYSINAAQETIENSQPLLESGNIYTNQYLTTYIIAGSIKLFGFDPYNPWSARLPSAVAGTLLILLTFVVTQRLFGNSWIALGAAIFVAFLPWEIAWSRQARGYILLQFFLVLSFDQLIAFLRSQKLIASLLAAFLLGIACLIHTIAIVFVPAFFFTFAVWLFLEKKEFNLFTLIPFFILLGVGAFLVISREGGIATYNYLGFYNNFISQHYLFITLLSLIGAIGALFGKKTFIVGTCLLSTFIFTYLMIALLGPTVQFRYLVAFVPFLGITLAYTCFIIPFGIIKGLKKIKKIQRKIKIRKLTPIISYSVPVLVIVIMISTQVFSLRTVSKLEQDSPQPNFKAAYQYIENNQQSHDIVISPYAHLTNIYLGETGVLLPISLTGRKDEFGLTITPEGKDYYTNAPTLRTDLEVFPIINKNHGYIVIDGMAQRRIPHFFKAFSNHPNITQVFSQQENNTWIWVFRFSNESLLLTQEE